MNKFNILSNAKVNIGLNIFQKATDGYHEIDSVMVPIDLADELEVTFFDEAGTLKIDCSDKKIPTNENNILYKAYSIFFNEINREPEKIEIYLKKNIPSEAGLGGGSSNAAFFLKLLNEYYKTNFDEKTLETLSMKVGSDVPFFIRNRAARVTGKGEKIEIIENNLSDSIILIKPNNIGISTKEAYEKFDDLKNIEYANFDKIKECLKNDTRILLEKEIQNGLEQAILEINFDIKILKTNLGAILSGKKFFMSGSGSTYYTFVTEKEKSQVEARLNTFVDNVQIVLCNFINK